MSEQKRPGDIFVGKSKSDWEQIGVERGWTLDNADVMKVILEQANEIQRLRDGLMTGLNLNRERIEEVITEMGDSTLLLDGFDEAFIGFSQRISQPLLAVYSYDGLVRVCMERDGMDWEEAVEYVDYNVAGAWVGEQTPIIVNTPVVGELSI